MLSHDQLNTPEGAARFFAFLEYPQDRISGYLVDRCGCTEEEAAAIAETAVKRHRETKDQDTRIEARNQRAFEAERDLSKSNWG